MPTAKMTSIPYFGGTEERGCSTTLTADLRQPRRLFAATRRFSGAGLGIRICKKPRGVAKATGPTARVFDERVKLGGEKPFYDFAPVHLLEQDLGINRTTMAVR